jgi:hypothetical protein
MNRIFGLFFPEFSCGKQIIAESLRVKCGPIEQSPACSFVTRLRKNIELLFCTIVPAGETKKFKKERSALLIGGVIPDLRIQGLDRIGKSACIEKSVWSHNPACSSKIFELYETLKLLPEGRAFGSESTDPIGARAFTSRISV